MSAAELARSKRVAEAKMELLKEIEAEKELAKSKG